MLRFKNDVINVKNNGKVFVENFDKAFKSESFPLALRVLHKIKGIIKLHNTGKFLEDNNFWFSFERPSKCIVAIILDLFWVSFYGICSQMWSSFYKNFTSDTMHGNA